MPILIKNFEWDQNETFVTVTVELPTGQNGLKSEIKVGRQLLNISCGSNFLFRLFLQNQIDKHGSKVTVKERNIVFNLKKVSDQTWTDLKHENNRKGFPICIPTWYLANFD